MIKGSNKARDPGTVQDVSPNLVTAILLGHRARFYRWCGFDTCRAPMPPDRPGFAPGCASSRVVFNLDWKDRLRILISGKAMVDLAHQTDRVPRRWESTSAFSVLPPNYPMGKNP